MIYTYLLKKITALYEHLAAQINQLLMDGTHPEWLTQGQTVLIMKERGRSIQLPANDLTLYNVEAPVSYHSAKDEEAYGFMSGTHRGIGINTQRAKHQLLINRTVTQDCKIKHTNLCTA